MILVDNASEDQSADYIKRCFPDVHLIQNLRNVGFSAANNIGAAHASGEYLAFLNPDTRVAPEWLEPMVHALQENKDAGLATPKILLSKKPQTINTCGNMVHITGLTFCRGMNRPADELSESKEVDAVSGAAFVIRKSHYLYLGGLDESFFTYLEDTDLSIRSRLNGKTCLYVPESVVYHDYQLRFGPRKTYYQERNRYLLLLKNFKSSTLLAMLPALILAEIVSWSFSLAFDRKNIVNKWLAYKWIIDKRKTIKKMRQEMAGLRRKPDKTVLTRCTHKIPFEQVMESPFHAIAHCCLDPIFFLTKRLCLLLITG